MKQVFTAGSLGDCYTIGLKLMKEDEDIEIFHHTALKFWYNEIREIYNLFNNIKKVNFVEFSYPDLPEISGIPEDGMVWFPDLNLPYIPISQDPYIVINPHAGRDAPDLMRREISVDKINYMIETLYPIPVVLIGTNEKYKHIKCYENLIGETSIKEAISILYDSCGFCGPEGFLAFSALSFKIPSIIFWIRWQPIEARVLHNKWTENIIDLIQLGGNI